MSDFAEILEAIERREPEAVARLLPFVYQELRALARSKLRHEPPGQTLQATALVHEAYLRLVKDGTQARWDSRAHFFAAAAEAMRRILIDNARRKGRVRHGGEMKRVAFDQVDLAAGEPSAQALALDEALERLEQEDAGKAQLVKLRYFAGLTLEEAGNVLGISAATADRHWAFAKAWLYREMQNVD
jgi:RNA polymerase sigma factor (TIGR02999 family)